jgi:hypothetical protein
MAAVGVTAANRSHWTDSPQLRGAYGLNTYGPAVGRHAGDLFTAQSFEEQVLQAVTFLRDTIEFFRSRGYIPTT